LEKSGEFAGIVGCRARSARKDLPSGLLEEKLKNLWQTNS
jgi:hypothetical protein